MSITDSVGDGRIAPVTMKGMQGSLWRGLYMSTRVKPRGEIRPKV
jgi:hypothetical protein